jgi:hypothetical protein
MPTPRYEMARQAMKTDAVRRKLAEVADRKAQQAQGIAAAAGVDVPVERVSGTRPKGRPFERIQIPAAHEHGDSVTKRLRVLGQIAGR